ncbi:PREDICTED: uncharacterized protein LOC105360763 [Ceratosolen solmsi marchali]|uniref:Uncharacterized protein LOC105360763 n=1 Tax=Ceratosolen solmsi marchali TaxID=326594 RepID=A0AAJ7DTD2_9HYME|nr:PREDICTED: uncharacterized protein LOC105360763 [Ceratosolen solmsi marchali]
MQSFDRNEDISADNDVDSDKIAIEINSQELKECQSNIRELKEKLTGSSHNQSSMMCYQDRKNSQPHPTPDSAEDDNGESSFISSSSSTSDAEDDDEPLDALQDKGWMDEVSLPSSQLQHEMNGHVLPANNPSEFGDVCIKNSSNVHLGSRVFYKGPVTIKQFVYTNSAAITDDPESLQSDGEKLKSNTTNSDSKSFDDLSLSKRPSHIFNFLAHHNKGN